MKYSSGGLARSRGPTRCPREQAGCGARLRLWPGVSAGWLVALIVTALGVLLIATTAV
jgi:hypothetical protein